jgi:hypothetical protein
MAEAAARAGLVRFEDYHGTLRANPPEVWVNSGDSLTLQYGGEAMPMLFVPNAAVFGDVLYTMSRHQDYWQIVLTVLKDAPVIDLPYALYGPDVNQIAEGNSPPRMNVNDPEKHDD